MIKGERGWFEYLLIRGSSKGGVHRANAANETDTHNQPWVHCHKTVRPAAGVQSAGSNSDNTNTKSSVHESLVQEAPLVGGHAAILAGLTVEDEVGGQDGTTDDGTSVQQLLGEVATLSVVGLLHVAAAEGIVEGLMRLGEERGLGTERLSSLRRLEWRAVDEASSIRELWSLSEGRRYGERAPKEESHDDDDVEGRREMAMKRLYANGWTGDIRALTHAGSRQLLSPNVPEHHVTSGVGGTERPRRRHF